MTTIHVNRQTQVPFYLILWRFHLELILVKHFSIFLCLVNICLMVLDYYTCEWTNSSYRIFRWFHLELLLVKHFIKSFCALLNIWLMVLDYYTCEWTNSSLSDLKMISFRTFIGQTFYQYFCAWLIYAWWYLTILHVNGQIIVL